MDQKNFSSVKPSGLLEGWTPKKCLEKGEEEILLGRSVLQRTEHDEHLILPTIVSRNLDETYKALQGLLTDVRRRVRETSSFGSVNMLHPGTYKAMKRARKLVKHATEYRLAAEQASDDAKKARSEAREGQAETAHDQQEVPVIAGTPGQADPAPQPGEVIGQIDATDQQAGPSDTETDLDTDDEPLPVAGKLSLRGIPLYDLDGDLVAPEPDDEAASDPFADPPLAKNPFATPVGSLHTNSAELIPSILPE